ncbi:putative quinol monooxygenase [Phenylobacterium sp.]|uniref:putative quinol monooxygenase n=1 Tax=Phenylobacterium sp. TaxID=1871053 RepID=UPI0035ADD75D
MIIILGSIQMAPGQRDAAIAVGLEHCARSRAEPGCISHDCHVDAADPDKLVFVERWADMAAVRTHFAVPASGEFVRRMATLASEPPQMSLYDATERPVG